MTTVIKATDRQRGIQQVAFNFEDLSERAETYLGQVRGQAEQILKQAQVDAQSIRQRAEQEGRRAAESAVDQLVEQKIARQLETVLPALRGAVQTLQNDRQAWLAEWERKAVHLAAAMAQRICRRELKTQPEITLDLVKEALELAAGSANVRILLNPQDLEALGGQAQLLVQEFSRLAPAELEADPTISLGGCRLETRYGTIDQQIESQLVRLEQELT